MGDGTKEQSKPQERMSHFKAMMERSLKKNKNFGRDGFLPVDLPP